MDNFWYYFNSAIENFRESERVYTPKYNIRITDISTGEK